MKSRKEELSRIHDALDQADASLVTALDERAKAIREFVRLREDDPDGYYALPRDDEVLSRARERAREFPVSGVDPVFREVISATSELVSPRRVHYVGFETGFAHYAARRHFGASAELRACQGTEEAIDDVVRGRAAFAVLAFETSSDGAVTATLQALEQSDVKISAELSVPSAYHLFSQSGEAARVQKIVGAPSALATCEHFVRTHFPKAQMSDVPSGEAAAACAQEDPTAAAIGTDLVSELRDLRVVHERIEDQHGVHIRYVVVGNDLPPRTGKDRTVLAMAVHDGPGGLYRALQPFADRDINLTRLESRPSYSGSWNYVFFVEHDGHVTDRAVLTALEELRGICRHLKVLGSYPRPE